MADFRNVQETITYYDGSIPINIKQVRMLHNTDNMTIAPLSDERRWDRWSWTTLAIGVLLVFWPILTTVYSYRYPTDGFSSTANDGFSIGGTYRLGDALTTEPTPLKIDDIVVAINGRPLLPDTPPPLPADLAAGQVLTTYHFYKWHEKWTRIGRPRRIQRAAQSQPRRK